MKSIHFQIILLFACWFSAILVKADTVSQQNHLSRLKLGQVTAGFRIEHLYIDERGQAIGAKFVHVRTSAPIFLLQTETVPKAFIWVDTPDRSDLGGPHALEHLLAGKGTRGRYVTLLTEMRLSETRAGTARDFTFYSFSSGTGLEGFFEQLHAWLNALFRADFSDAEAERELYHFGVSVDSANQLALVEQGSVYDENQPDQSAEAYYFELNKRLLGSSNPFAWDIRGNPDSMRDVSPQDIRRFYQEHYRLGPTTGFIFTLNPRERVPDFLERISREFDAFAVPSAANQSSSDSDPKYPIQSSDDRSIGIYPFPSGTETNAAAIRFGWRPLKTESTTQLKLLQLLFQGLAADQSSLLYKALVDSKAREFDSGARKVDYDVFLYNSPRYPFEQIEVSGIPGNRMSVEQIEKIRNVILDNIRQLSDYPDQSSALRSFNDLILSHAKSRRRTEIIWIKTPPQFGIDLSMEWKQHLNALEMDRSFTLSLAEEPTWNSVELELHSGKNIWRELISTFHLLDTPVATASKPSPEVMRSFEAARQQRIQAKIAFLRQHYHVSTDQEALANFKAEETVKTREIDAIQSKVPRPRFANNPPLTPDDDIHYKQFQLEGVPVVASLFDRPPTIDIGLSFDLHNVPRKYYKYLPILPRCFDSIGLHYGEQVVSYSELLKQIQEKTLNWSVGYDENAASGRADLVFRTSAADTRDFKIVLNLLGDILHHSACDLSSVERLRDLVNQRLAVDESFKNDEFRMLQNTAYSFLNQRDPLFQAVYSTFTRSHWDERLKWKLHDPVDAHRINELKRFATNLLSQAPEISAAEISRQLERSDPTSLQKELLEYWQRNISSFPDGELTRGLQQLTSEVQEDLIKGPKQTVSEIQELQTIVLSRNALYIDLTTDQEALHTIEDELIPFVKTLPVVPFQGEKQTRTSTNYPIMKRISERYGVSNIDFPWYVGLLSPNAVNGDLLFYAALSGYADLDRPSLIKILSSKIFAENGPQSFFIKTREVGLAYAIWLTSSPEFKLLWDYADRSPDIPQLITLLNAVAEDTSNLNDSFILDYALRQTFSVPRTVYTPSVRGIAIAQDLRDGNDPHTIRKIGRAILKLRHDPSLFSELTRAAVPSICGILLESKCMEQQKSSHSIFFFVGSSKTLSDIGTHLSVPRLLRLSPSDYWLQ